MIGEQRSGSNLLRLVLNEHPQIAAPHPPHILTRFTPILDCYGDLNKADNFDLLVEDVCELIERNPIGWGIEFDKDKREVVKKYCRKRSEKNGEENGFFKLIAIFDAVMNIYAETHTATHWVCKSLHNVKYAKDIESYYNKPLYIYLYRDPRDVVLSFKKAVVGEKHPYFSAKRWKDLQIQCLELQKQIPSERLIAISYENLTQKPEDTIKKICAFLGVNYLEQLLHFYDSVDAVNAASSSSLWENLEKPILPENSKKFKKELTKKEINIIESICGNLLDELNYKRFVYNGESKMGKQNEIVFSQEEIEEFEKLNFLEKEKMKRQMSFEDLSRRNRQLAVLERFKVGEN